MDELQERVLRFINNAPSGKRSRKLIRAILGCGYDTCHELLQKMKRDGILGQDDDEKFFIIPKHKNLKAALEFGLSGFSSTSDIPILLAVQELMSEMNSPKVGHIFEKTGASTKQIECSLNNVGIYVGKTNNLHTNRV